VDVSGYDHEILHPLPLVSVEDGLGDLAPLGLEAVPLVQVHVDAVRGVGVAAFGGLGHGREDLISPARQVRVRDLELHEHRCIVVERQNFMRSV
jgi:hypothetical protein